MDYRSLNRDTTVAELNELFWSDKKKGNRNHPEKLAYSKHVCRHFGSCKVIHFNGTAARKVRREMLEGEYRPATINSIISTGKKEFRAAMEAGIIEDNPWENVPLLALDDDFANDRPIAKEDLEVLYREFDHLLLGNFAKLVGSRDTRDIRPAMILGVRVSDINEDTSTLTIRGGLVYGGFTPCRPFPLHLTESSMAIVRDEIAKRDERKKRCIPEDWNDNPDYLFCDWNGEPITRKILNAFLTVIQLDTGFEWFTFQRLHGHVKATESLNS